jgi:hypothetical protein
MEASGQLHAQAPLPLKEFPVPVERKLGWCDCEEKNPWPYQISNHARPSMGAGKCRMGKPGIKKLKRKYNKYYYGELKLFLNVILLS